MSIVDILLALVNVRVGTVGHLNINFCNQIVIDFSALYCDIFYTFAAEIHFLNQT